MLLLDEPYLSDFLIDTIRAYKFKIIATPAAKALLPDDRLDWVEEGEAVHQIKNNPPYPLYSISENGLDWVERHLPGSELVGQIRALKDKVKFREILQDIFPDFHFQQVSLEDIQRLEPEELSYPFVIKPSIGFLASGCIS